MRKALTYLPEIEQVGTISDLTNVFQSIASIRIARIKGRVVSSQRFFNELWSIYSQLRVDPNKRLAHSPGPKRDKPNVFLVLSSDAGLSGDIDMRVIRRVKEQFDPATTDVIVIGAHGATQLAQAKIPVKKYFRLPGVEQNVDVSPIATELAGYRQPLVFFERYFSLTDQRVVSIDLLTRVRSIGSRVQADSKTPVISNHEYLFEPSINEIVEYMESVMVEIALSQVILESRLAQYASRFNAMSAAFLTASEMKKDLYLGYRRAKRSEGDTRIKETINALNATASE